MTLAATLPTMPVMPTFRIPPGFRAALALAACVGAGWMITPRDPALTQLQLRGDFEHLRAEDVRLAAEPFLDTSFFGADLDAIRRAVTRLPWVARARVERDWPGAITIRAWERQPFARWNETGLLDTTAAAFSPRASEIPSGLPKLSGSAGSEGAVAQAWQRISPALQNTPLALAGLNLDRRGEWTARTLDGIDLRFGQLPPDEHLPVLRGAAQRALTGRWQAVRYIDLRYTNGFAVGWAEASPEAGEAPGARPAPSADTPPR